MKLFTLAAYLFMSASLFAQENQEQKTKFSDNYHTNLLVSVGLSAKDEFVLGLAIQLTKANNDLGIVLGFKEGSYEANNYPINYEASTNLFANLFSSKKKVVDLNLYYSLAVMKNFYSKNRVLKYSVQAGPSLNTHTFHSFVPNPRSSGYSYFGYPSNYNIYKKHGTTLGASLESSIGVALKKGNYFELSAFSNFNQYENLLGGELKLVLKVF